MKNPIYISALMIITILISTRQVSAKNLYVSTSGNDVVTYAENDINHPWRTISKVNSGVFFPGDNVLFNRGETWNEQLVVPSSGDATGYIKFGAYGTGRKPVFDGTNIAIPKWEGLIYVYDKSYILIDNLRVINVNIEHPTIPNGSAGIKMRNSQHLVVSHCEVYNTAHLGLAVNHCDHVLVDANEVSHACMDINSPGEQISLEAVSFFEVKNNVSHDNGINENFGQGAGIDIKNGSHNGTVHHNEVYHIDKANHIYIDAFTESTSNIEVYNNYLHDGLDRSTGIITSSERGGLLENIKIHHNIIANGMRAGITIHPGTRGEGTLDPVKDLFFYNNTIINCGLDTPSFVGGFLIRNPDSENIHIKNNIFSQNTGYQVGFSTLDIDQPIDRSQFHIDYNLMHGAINTTSTTSVDGVAGTNPILSDPLFVSTTDLHLQVGSPAIDSCDSSVWEGTPNIKDFDGNPVTDAAGNVMGGMDCGAYSYNISSPTIRADVDQSGIISTTDALLTLRNFFGLSMYSTNWRPSATTGDVNCDGVSNSTDAALILRSSLGLGMRGTGWCGN